MVSLAALLLIFTIGVSYRFNFINYDYATEPMVYAHATPDVKLAMSQIEELSRKTGGDHSIRVAYDDDSTWPLEWYLRDYPNKAYYGANPSPRRDGLAGSDRGRQEPLEGEALPGRPLLRIPLPADLVAAGDVQGSDAGSASSTGSRTRCSAGSSGTS